MEKYINFDIIHIIIIDLLHLNGNNFKDIEEVEIETLYILIKLINDTKIETKTSFSDLNEHKNIFNEYIKIVLQIIDNLKLSKRSVFFLNEIISIFKNFIDNKKVDKNDKCVKIEIQIDKKTLNELLKANNTKELLNIYKSDNYLFTYNLIEIFISQKNINKTIITILDEINNTNLILSIVEKIIVNIDDIMLDIPDANYKILHIINNIKEHSPVKTNIINILKDLESESDSSSDDE